MGLFGSSGTPSNGDALVDGTGDGGDKQQKKGGGIIGVAVGVIIMLVFQPIAVIVFAVLAVVGEKRRIRLSRWSVATAVATIIGILGAGLSPSRWLSWWATGAALVLGDTASIFANLPGLNQIDDATFYSTGGLFIRHTLFAVPLALLTMTLWWWARSWSLRLRGENEGAEYSNIRPVGWMDRMRAKRNEEAVSSSDWSRRHPGEVVIGVGTYGEVASAALDWMKKAIAIVGTSRSGKTRLANSIAAQQVHELGCGNITLDLKGDDDMARAKAKLAEEMGVPFLHFKMLPKAGGGYRKPHPYAPPKPASYDPFSRGNGASKAAMLLGSVPREGDAAVYERTALEVVQLAFDIAALTGLDKHTTAEGHPMPGLSVLLSILEGKAIVDAGSRITAEQVMRANPFLSATAAESKARSIRSRVETLKGELEKPGSIVNGAISDTRSLVNMTLNDPSVGMFLGPGTTPVLRIDLVRAILRNEIVLFSLPAQDYPQMAALIATMVLLDLQNAVSTLREYHQDVAEYLGVDADTADATPWNPMIVQIEELGSVRSPAAAEAMLGLFNKSADVGIRPILSTQSLADIEAVDTSGVWLRQLFGQLTSLISLQLSVAEDAEKFAAFSGLVPKKIPTESKSMTSTRTGLFQGAGTAGRIMARTEQETRIGAGDALALDIEQRELLWVSKTPKLTAVHTTAPEGPNNWAEKLTLTPVWEPPYKWRPFDDPEYVDQCATTQQEAYRTLIDDLETNPMLYKILSADAATLDVEESAVDVATAMLDAGEPVEHPLPYDGLPDTPGPADVTEPPSPPARRRAPAPRPQEHELPDRDRTIPMPYDTADDAPPPPEDPWGNTGADPAPANPEQAQQPAAQQPPAPAPRRAIADDEIDPFEADPFA